MTQSSKKGLLELQSEDNSRPLRLHIGGDQVKQGWKILNIEMLPGVDYLGNATDLSQFKDASVDQIYASHIYEHLDYNGELQHALSEAFRVLRPGGIFGLGVPDLEVLAGLILNPELDFDKKFHVMRMIFGGHINKYDYHYVGLTFQLLGSLLEEAGFQEISKVKTFGLFNDTTTLVFEGASISLNVMAKKPNRN